VPQPETPEPDPPSEVISRLLDAGYDATSLSNALDVPLENILPLVPPERRRLIAADAQLAEAMRMLAWRSIEETLRLLDEGSIPVKMKLLQKFTGDLARAIASTDHDDLEDMRADFRALMRETRGQ
jgi:hypothetical protein